MSNLEILVAIEERIPALLKGESRPKNNAERLVLGGVCYDKRLHSAAVQFWGEALADAPKLGEDRGMQYRYYAACSAVLAAAGKGEDNPKPDTAARAALRSKAKDWLREELRAWEKVLETGIQEYRTTVARTMTRWKANADLAGVRDADALAKLPEEERQAWVALWADVEALLAKAGAKP